MWWVVVEAHFSVQLNPFCPGGRWSLYSLGEVNLTHTFCQHPGPYLAIILSILIIILFKERINDFLEKNGVNNLKIGRNIEIFVGQEIF